MIKLPTVPEAVPYEVGDVFSNVSGCVQVVAIEGGRVTYRTGSPPATGSVRVRTWEKWLRTARRVT